jgi:hypothetical protein
MGVMTNPDSGAPQDPPAYTPSGSHPSGGYGQQPPAYGQQPPAYGQQPSGYPGYAQQSPGYPQQQPVGQQPYAAYGSPYPPAPATNTLAIITIIAAFVVPIVGIVTGHIALNQLKTSGEQGAGLAKAGLIISYVYCALVVVILVISIVAPLLMFAAFVPFWSSVPASP